MTESPKRSRGRPRKYDAETALTSAMQIFWHRGIAGTSYDDLVVAMEMNRPSIYRAFGNKEAIYQQSLELFGNAVLAQLDEMLNSGAPLRVDIDQFMDQALDAYCGVDQAMGCFIACTAVADSVVHPEVQPDILRFIEAIDQAFEQRLRRAQADGELIADVNAKMLAQSIQGLMHTLAVRARAGQSKRSLKKLKRFMLEQWLAAHSPE